MQSIGKDGIVRAGRIVLMKKPLSVKVFILVAVYQ